MKNLISLLCFTFLISFGGISFAVEPDEILSDSVLEERAREISKEIRCLVCQNESIDDSNSDLAKTLRVIVRERLVEGDTDKQVKQFIVDRFGEYALLKPTLNLKSAVLYLSPVILLLFALLSVGSFIRSGRGKEHEAPLGEQEILEIKDILESENNDTGTTNKE